ncbi:choice-of-anchor Q domain-containing protein [Candidatus Electronema sp. TJ]|uniref:choice-of-anchor Q domain-containing protein n=1 Tax=Candidatus Electronema sp. TJ TaxID=3401573 RepID=UPI003AA8E5DB
MNTALKGLLFSTALLLAASAAQATVVVVDAAGNCTLQEAMQFVQGIVIETKCVDSGGGVDAVIMLETDAALSESAWVDEVNVTIEGQGHTVAGTSAISAFIVYNRRLTLNNITVTGGNEGIAVRETGALTLNNATVRGNAGDGIVIGGGGATLNNSTVSGNGGKGISSGFGSIILKNSTVSGNAVGIYAYKSSVFMQSSLVSGNSGFDIENNASSWLEGGGFNVLGHSGKTNAEAFSSTFAPNSTDVTATSDGSRPTALAGILSPLADNGGLTQTHALPAGSPAIDLDEDCLANLSADQRGISRPSGNGCDAGAFEFVAVVQHVNMVPVYKLLLD